MNPFCQFKKDDKLVTITDNGKDWNYKKETGSTILENFDISDLKIQTLYKELIDFGYNIVLQSNETFKSFSKGWAIHKKDGEILKITSSYGDVAFYKNDKLHCETGAAVIWRNGHKEHWVDDVFLTEEDFNEKYGKTNV